MERQKIRRWKRLPIESNWTVSLVTHTFTFWLILAGLCSMSALSTGLTFHVFRMFSDGDLSTTSTAAIFVPIAITTAAVQLGGGLLIDRIPIKVLLSISLFLQAVVLMIAPYLITVQVALLFGLLMGA